MSNTRQAKAGDVWSDPQGDLYLIVYIKHGATSTGYTAKYLNWSQCCQFDGTIWNEADDVKFTDDDVFMFNMHEIFEDVEETWKRRLWELSKAGRS
jgi:hypothetical protein